MKKSNIILFPTDFSEASENAFRYALRLADHMNSSLVVVNAVSPAADTAEFPEVSGQVLRALLDAARESMKRFVDAGITQVLPSLKNPPSVSTTIEIGSAEGTISDLAEKENADFVIMGSRGTNRGTIEKLFGSVTTGVVGSSKRPVWVIPENAEFSPLNVVAYATNALNADPFEIWKSIKVLDPFVPTIRIVHVDLEKEGDLKAWEMMDELRDYFEEKPPEMSVKFHYLIGEKIENELNEFMENYEVDLLIMYQPKHGFWDRLFHKSATKRMALRSDKPLLVQKDF